MAWRGLGVAVVLAVVGALLGAGLALSLREEPTRLDATTPASASSPSVPTDPPVEVLPDPLTPALEPDLPTHVAKVGQRPFGLTLPVPDGWSRSNPTKGEWRWFVEGHPPNTYVLRAVLPSGYRTVARARDDRIEDLDGATGIEDFTVEETGADGFVATYVLEGYKRVTMERYLALDGGTTVYAVIAMTGREADRDGMTSLIDTVVTGARRWE